MNNKAVRMTARDRALMESSFVNDSDLQMRVSITVQRLKEHSETVHGVIVREDIRDGIKMILELYDKLNKGFNR